MSFKIFYSLSVCDIANIFLQNWGDYTDMSQALIGYVIFASGVILICWFGTKLTQHVRQKGFL
jgi:amino acid permease